MEPKVILVIGFTIATSFLQLGTVLWFLNERNIKNNSTEKTKGTVVGYFHGNDAHPPKVEYSVNGKNYRRRLTYEVVTVVSAPWKSVKAESNSDLLGPRLKIYRNSFISYTSILKEAFPIGTQMTVWYNPKNPKKSYVERYAGPYKSIRNSLILVSFMWLLVVGVLIYILTTGQVL